MPTWPRSLASSPDWRAPSTAEKLSRILRSVTGQCAITSATPRRSSAGRLAGVDSFYRSLAAGRPAVNREHLAQVAPRSLEEADQRGFLRSVEASPSSRDRAMGTVFFYARLRLAELAALDVADVEMSARRGRVEVRAGKGDAYREVPLNSASRKALDEWLPARAAQLTALDEAGDDAGSGVDALLRASVVVPSAERLDGRCRPAVGAGSSREKRGSGWPVPAAPQVLRACCEAQPTCRERRRDSEPGPRRAINSGGCAWDDGRVNRRHRPVPIHDR